MSVLFSSRTWWKSRVVLIFVTLVACVVFMPYGAYLTCGSSRPGVLPTTVRVGLYEEFPTPDRLQKLSLVDFPVSLAVASPSRSEFVLLRDEILAAYPAVGQVYFWPVLAQADGYYAGPLSASTGLRQAMREAKVLPALWDLEWPRGPAQPAWSDWLRNRNELAEWIANRKEPIHIWRTYAFLGLDPAVLRLAGFHFDPSDYPQVWLHLDLYRRGNGLPHALTARIVRCGVEHYGEHFIPSFGVLNDGLGSPDQFVTPAGLERDLESARQAGVSEVWLFGLNGLNAEYLAALHASLPLEPLPAGTTSVYADLR